MKIRPSGILGILGFVLILTSHDSWAFLFLLVALGVWLHEED